MTDPVQVVAEAPCVFLWRRDEIVIGSCAGRITKHPECAVAALTAAGALMPDKAQALRQSRDERSNATVYERVAWHHSTGEHADSEHPYDYCPRCEMEHPDGRFRVQKALLQEVREVLELLGHRERTSGIGKGHCVACRHPWPCPEAALLDKLKGLETTK